MGTAVAIDADEVTRVNCAICRSEHARLDPAFMRPEAVLALSASERDTRALESDDLCLVRAAGPGQPARGFVRGTLEVRLRDCRLTAMWGLWAEVPLGAFGRLLELWTDPEQQLVPPLPAWLANRVPGYADTLGLPVALRLTGLRSRPALEIAADGRAHPFAAECLHGVTTERVAEWQRALA